MASIVPRPQCVNNYLQVFTPALVLLASIVAHPELTILVYVQSCMTPVRPQSRTYRHRFPIVMSAACVASRIRMCSISFKVPLGTALTNLVGFPPAQAVLDPAAPTVSTTLVKYRHWTKNITICTKCHHWLHQKFSFCKIWHLRVQLM